ncbi:serine/threonine protein kinase [Brunnivagina elsteri]|uniref:non-specific serine/threonine protein kinase n=1 Tax=Brunnivagina elsteri CCALA 953 TaxID=987040 RepID=A0A2A2TE28_9CYAN|nr:serine/threonine-protein kinase [Calothrix elsteri]PAX51908.1 serine/threonine protein kinase [Calothrix elsteri CCALA 953]
MAWVSGQKLHNNKYEIKQELGRGRVAITYLAVDSNNTKVVIKTLNPDILNQLSDRDRNYLESGFADESRKLALCKHPNIVRVIENFKYQQLDCMVMEHIDGDNLGNILASRRQIPEKEALGYIQQIGQALIEVHKQGFLHRDIKPENIVLRKGTYQVVLIDFDLARGFDSPLTSRGNRVDGFTAIELYFNTARSQQQRGAWTDVYSLAATLYMLLTGEKPVSSCDRKDNNIGLKPPKEHNSHISDRVNRAIIHGMELEGEKRPQAVQEWLDELGLKRKFSFSRIPKIPVWAGIIGILSTLAIFAALISGVKDGRDLWKDLFPDASPTQTNPATKDTPK